MLGSETGQGQSQTWTCSSTDPFFPRVLLGFAGHIAVIALRACAVLMWAGNCFHELLWLRALSAQEGTPGLSVGTCAHVSQISSYTELNFPGPKLFLQSSRGELV